MHNINKELYNRLLQRKKEEEIKDTKYFNNLIKSTKLNINPTNLKLDTKLVYGDTIIFKIKDLYLIYKFIGNCENLNYTENYLSNYCYNNSTIFKLFNLNSVDYIQNELGIETNGGGFPEVKYNDLITIINHLGLLCKKTTSEPIVDGGEVYL